MMTCFKSPVGAAVVSTSIDATTTTTDASGHFLLTTAVNQKDFDGCRPYTLTILPPQDIPLSASRRLDMIRAAAR